MFLGWVFVFSQVERKHTLNFVSWNWTQTIASLDTWRDDVQVAGQSLEHVSRVHERVEREGHGHEDHADDDDHEGSLGPEKVVIVAAWLGQELVVILTLGLRLAEKKVAALPEAWKRPSHRDLRKYIYGSFFGNSHSWNHFL